MALVLKDRVKETSTTAGTGTITLAGAVAGFQSFSAVGNGNTTYYAIVDPTTGDWEVGIGTYTSSGTTLSRDTVLSSSNSGSLVNFVANQKDVFVTYPSEKSVYEDASNVVNATSFGAITATSAALTTGTVSTAPASGTDIANKTYVDTLVSSGITYHTPVKYEVPDSTGNLNATYNQPGGPGVGVGATLTNAGTLVAFTPDGTVATAGDRIIIYNQTNQFENGVYTVTTVGSGAVAWVLTRATDADTYALKSPNGLGNGDAFFITSGATGAGETYVCNTAGVITFGTTAITFAQISDSTLYTAGTGLTLTGTEFSITPTGTAGTYGSASSVPVLTTNASGQVTSVTNTTIAINGSQVSGNISGSAGSVANALTLGTYLTGTSFNGSAAVTATVDATSANTASKVVARDSSGNFSAGTITATLSGSATSATTATNLAGGAANQIAYQSASGTTSFATAPSASNQVLSWNGSAFSWSAGTISGVPLGSNLNSLTAGTYLTGTAYNGSAAQTWAVDATSANTASKVVARDASGDFSAGTITASLSGNATTATTATNQSGGTVNATTGAFSGTLTGTAALFSGQGRFGGWYTSGTGNAVEVGISSGSGYVISFNRTTSAYTPLNLQGDSALLQLSGSTVNVVTGALQQGGSQVLTAANYNSYAPTLTGTGASGTWNISITGSAGSAPGYLPLSGGTMTGTITGGSGVSDLVTGNYAGALRGYLYNDTNGFGLLTYAGSWAVRVDYGTNSVYIPGIGYSAASLRAPIFYDTDNTGYYVDAASTSQLSTVYMDGWLYKQNTAGIYFTAYSYGIQAAGVVGSYGNIATYGTGQGGWNGYNLGGQWTLMNSGNGDNIGIHSNSTSWLWYWDGGVTNFYRGYTQFANSARAPIFYDTDNTAFYLDPASSSSLNALYTYYYRRQGGGYGYLDGGYGSQETGATSGPIYTIGGSYVPGTTSLGNMYGVGYTVGNISGISIVSNWGFYVASNGTARHFLDSDTGTGYSTGSYRAPIFYDYNDTGYYVDPASTSNISATYIGGHLYTSYNSTNPIIRVSGAGDAGLLLQDSGSNFKVQIYGTGSNYGFLNGAWAGWDIQKTVSGNLYLNGNGSYYLNPASDNNFYRVYGQADMRSPIYYDLNNTAYYVDPASTSLLYTVTCNNYGSAGSSLNINWPHSGYINFWGTTGQTLNINNASGLQVNLVVSGNVTAYSDERRKHDWQDVSENYVQRLAAVRSGTYMRSDGGSDIRQAGVGAQSFYNVLPEVVTADENGYLSLAYGNAALVSAVELAKYVTALEQRISQLEARI